MDGREKRQRHRARAPRLRADRSTAAPRLRARGGAPGYQLQFSRAGSTVHWLCSRCSRLPLAKAMPAVLRLHTWTAYERVRMVSHLVRGRGRAGVRGRVGAG